MQPLKYEVQSTLWHTSACRLEILFTCWPAILVLIGAEILLQVYIAKEQQPVIKYDLSSIIIILVVVIFSMGILHKLETNGGGKCAACVDLS